MNTKTSKRNPPGSPAYHRLTGENRIIIRALLKEGHSQAEIARHLGVSRSTISHELRRNKSKKGYRAKMAQSMADRRAKVKAGKHRKFTEAMWKWAMERLAKGWTFAQIAGRAKRDGVEMVCDETLYKEYYRRQRLVRAGTSAEELPPLPMRRKQRKCRDRDAKKYRNAGRGKIKNRVDIDERPANVENRARVGNWEGDLINGLHGTGNLVTAVERMTRFTLVGYAATKETDVVMAEFVRMLGALPPSMLLSLTLDNGKEFAAFEKLRQALGFDVYFAKPYHSWERGTNENRNGVVRKVLPKGSSFADLSDETLKRIDYRLNDRPLKCLNWRTPREAFAALVARHVFAKAA